MHTNEQGLRIELSTSNFLLATDFMGSINQIPFDIDNPPTTTLLATTVKSLSINNGNITQTQGTSNLYKLTVANDVNLNGISINIGDNFENNAINIGNSQSTVSYGR
jgi:hypothetical protein